MKLDDFLKPKKVRCINSDNRKDLTDGKLYDVAGAACGRLRIHNDNGDELWIGMNCFELVIDSAENPPQGMELTPEFEAVEPKFKVGDKVYFDLSGRIAVIDKLDGSNDFSINNSGISEGLMKSVCLATQENYERLQATFPDIEFEQPPKPLTGSDLARAMLDKGWHLVPCVVSDVSDSDALNHDNCCLVDEWCVNYFDSDGYRYKYAVPFDPRTGEPLTESILND